MCLETVDKKTRKNVTYGYKVFEETSKGLLPYIRTYSRTKPYPINKWIRDRNPASRKINYSSGRSYSAGFHVFTSLRSAKRERAFEGFPYCVRKVLVKNIVASGKQYGDNICIAREMLITDERLK